MAPSFENLIDAVEETRRACWGLSSDTCKFIYSDVGSLIILFFFLVATFIVINKIHDGYFSKSRWTVFFSVLGYFIVITAILWVVTGKKNCSCPRDFNVLAHS